MASWDLHPDHVDDEMIQATDVQGDILVDQLERYVYRNKRGQINIATGSGIPENGLYVLGNKVGTISQPRLPLLILTAFEGKSALFSCDDRLKSGRERYLRGDGP